MLCRRPLRFRNIEPIVDSAIAACECTGTGEVTLLSLSSSGSACFVSYDKQWQPCSEGEAAYALTLESSGGAAHIEATRLADDKLLYSLDVKLPGGAAQ